MQIVLLYPNQTAGAVNLHPQGVDIAISGDSDVTLVAVTGVSDDGSAASVWFRANGGDPTGSGYEISYYPNAHVDTDFITGTSDGEYSTMDAVTGSAAGTNLAVSGSSNRLIDTIDPGGTEPADEGTVLVSGSSTKAITTVTGAATGQPPPNVLVVEYGATITLQAHNPTITAGAEFIADSNLVTAAITGLATGSVPFLGPVIGDSSVQIGVFTGTASSETIIVGASDGVVASISGNAEGNAIVSGASTQEVGAITGAGVGVVLVQGASNKGAEGFDGIAEGQCLLPLTGDSSAQIVAVTGTASSEIISSGVSAQAVQAITGEAIAINTIVGTSDTSVAIFAGTGTGSIPLSGESGIGLVDVIGIGSSSVLAFGGSAISIALFSGVSDGLVTDYEVDVDAGRVYGIPSEFRTHRVRELVT